MLVLIVGDPVDEECPALPAPAASAPFDAAAYLRYAGARIAAVRRRSRLATGEKLTQERLAGLVGLARPTVGNFEVGMHWLHMDTLLHICAVLQISPRSLFPAAATPDLDEVIQLLDQVSPEMLRGIRLALEAYVGLQTPAAVTCPHCHRTD